MRKLTTAITAAALAFSMLAAAVPAAAITGYDSAYAGESAFVNIVAGQTQNFQVFFANTGTTSWVKSTGTQVDLAACMEDKVTCNAQDASEATWNSGWLSATRYATTTQTTTPPGSLGTFSYNIAAPAGVAAGIYHFNGDVVLASTGEKIHPEGYFQDANTGASAGAATITSITNSATAAPSGSANGGDTANITGTGIVCNPTFPTVSFGGTNGVVTSCGATAITVTTPAHATGAVTVTVTNPGAGPSNGLSWTYNDTTTPKFNSFTVSGKFVTVTWSEPVCRTIGATGTIAGDWTVLNVSAPGPNPVVSDSTPTCDLAVAPTNATSTSNLILTTAMPNGAFVETTLNNCGTQVGACTPASASRNYDYRDTAGDNTIAGGTNFASAPQSRQATATALETTKPQVISASGAVGSKKITLNFSEPVYCTGLNYDASDFTITDNNTSTTDPVVAGIDVSTTPNLCGTSTAPDTSFAVTTDINLPADRTYTITLTPEGSEITDTVGNVLGDASGTACNTPTLTCTVTFTTGAGDFTPPTIVDARVVNNVGSSDFFEVGDSFSLTFSEAMNGCTTGTTPACSMDAQDQDGTSYAGAVSGISSGRLQCGANVSCSWNTALTTVTVTVNTALTPPPLGQTGSGTTQGMQIPFNITALNGINDTAGNPPNVLGSADRLVDYE